MVEESTQDLSVSRPLARVPWSIPVDAATGVYVWLDALTNYLTTGKGPRLRAGGERVREGHPEVPRVLLPVPC